MSIYISTWPFSKIVKDALAIMYCRTMAKMHKKTEEKLTLLREQQSEKTKRLLGAFYDVLLVCKEKALPEVMGVSSGHQKILR